MQQLPFDFPGCLDLPRFRDRLRSAFGLQRAAHRLDPLSQLIKSMVSARTYDEAAFTAFLKLRNAYPDWAGLADATQVQVEPVIAGVVFAEVKARQIPHALRVIRQRTGGLDLSFLAAQPVDQAMNWLQGLPGVGAKAAAAVLNFSNLRMRSLVVDTHVHRVAKRLGIVGRSTSPTEAYHAMMEQADPAWDAEVLYELHWLIKGLGQSACTHEAPRCGLCPLRDSCARVGVETGKVLAWTRTPLARAALKTPLPDGERV